MALVLRSPAFVHGGPIPAEYTCEGRDSSPPLEWSGAPAGTKSFALIVEDPDAPDPAAPKRVWVHWIVYDIPADVTRLEKGASSAKLPPGSREGLNDAGRLQYHGPCPPIGKHRYFHRLFALDTVLGPLRDNTKAGLVRAMDGHVLATAELMGTYVKSRR